MSKKVLFIGVVPILFLSVFFTNLNPVLSNGVEEEKTHQEGTVSENSRLDGLDEKIRSISVTSTIISTIILLILLFISAVIKEETELQKHLLFWPIAATILINTILISGLTVYLNLKSIAGGPVHWHAATEFSACGENIDLINPTGFSNKVGSAVVHEHDDGWIHIEGVPLSKRDSSIGNFLSKVGVILEDDYISIPTDSGSKNFKNGDKCGEDSGKVQVFLYTFKKNGDIYEYTQRKFKDAHEAKNYSITETGSIPPGDCIIFEFDKEKDKTDKLCKVYEAAKMRGDIKEKNV